MSYGILIPNTTSLSSTPESFISARLISVLLVRTWNSSATVLDYDSTKGFFFAKNLTTYYGKVQRLAWNNTTKVLSWTTGGSGGINDNVWSRNFDVYFFRSEV